MELAFDDGNIHVQMRNLLVLFLLGSKFLPHFRFLDYFVTDPVATVVHANGNQFVCF